jgi:LmbE family N-acetylglucosaminyl deacetylase
MATWQAASVLLIAAHPDDEVIGVGSQLASFPNLTIAHVTDGAPRNMQDAARHGFASAAEYARARRSELDSALDVLGAGSARRIEMGFPDQGVAWALPQVIHTVLEVIKQVKPSVIFTHPYEGGHPDHDACAFAVHRTAATAGVSQIVEFACYHAGPEGIRTGEFLEGDGSVVELTPAQATAKRRAFACFKTQQETLSLFHCRTERIRIAPTYDFTRPPHEGKLYYENFDRGVTSARFCELVRQECRS